MCTLLLSATGGREVKGGIGGIEGGGQAEGERGAEGGEWGGGDALK